MKIVKTPLVLAMVGAIALSACTDPSQLGGYSDGTDPNAKAKSGALIGAGVGAVAGAVLGGSDDRARGALVGAAVGGATGGLIGNQLDKQEADLRRDLNNDDVQITNTGDRLIVTLPQDILFATDSSTVRSDLQRDLRTVAGNLQAYPDSTIQIVGHTDNSGEAVYNQQLSERRAQSVADVLIGAGIPVGRIQAIGRGEDQPIASNLTPEGKAQNRRVDIVILPNA
ncbi:MAG: OmpA family protein [Paracoccaceae bacterium]